KKEIPLKTDKVEKQIGKMEVNPTMIEVAKLGKRVFTLQDFVENYAEIPFQLKAKYKGDKGIIKCLQDMLMEWSIYLDGVEQGLLETDRVKMMIENINKVITVQAIVKEYFEPKIPLNDGEVKKYYENNKIRFTVPEQIRIMEIVTGDETVALEVLGQLKKGADFGELVKKYSVARSKVNNGIVEFFPRRRNSEYFDKIAFALKKDEISGVIKDSNMFKIIKNIDRVEPKEKPFSEVKKFIEDFLKKDKKVKFIDDYIVELKKEYHFNANYENLKIVRPEELEKVKNEKLFIFDKGSMTVGEFFKQLDNLPAKMRNSVTPEKRKSILKSMENVFILYTLKDKLSPGMLKRVEKTKERKKVKAIASEVQAKKIKEIVKKIKISDKDILNYYEKNKEVYSVPAKRKARQILVKTEKEAQDVIDELKKGTDFVYLAKSRSIDKGSSTKGGDIGFVAENQVIKPLGKALIELDVGEISNKPIKTGFGYYILKVEDKVPGKIAELSKIRDRILAKLKRDAQFAEIDKWYLELSRKYKGTVYKTEFLKSWKRK
ncbi:peptidyl-prolyl cis-trans isomerase, partial [bacterium]|nr:peptidyl-prolyl cis-trans isomerase [bacterium]